MPPCTSLKNPATKICSYTVYGMVRMSLHCLILSPLYLPRTVPRRGSSTKVPASCPSMRCTPSSKTCTNDGRQEGEGWSQIRFFRPIFCQLLTNRLILKYTNNNNNSLLFFFYSLHVRLLGNPIEM